jgi:hypothetical protein
LLQSFVHQSYRLHHKNRPYCSAVRTTLSQEAIQECASYKLVGDRKPQTLVTSKLRGGVFPQDFLAICHLSHGVFEAAKSLYCLCAGRVRDSKITVMLLRRTPLVTRWRKSCYTLALVQNAVTLILSLASHDSALSRA